MSKILVSTNAQKIMDCLIQHPASQFLAGEIQKAAKVSKGGVNLALRKLASEKLLKREKRGRTFFYTVEYSEPIIKQLKVLKNIEFLSSLVNKIKALSIKIVLFGSSARGEDAAKSDIDIFILTHNPRELESMLNKQKLRRKIQPIIRNPVSFAEMQKKEPVFFEEIARGITLWEAKE